MTNTTKIIETCGACNGAGILDAGCDIEHQTSCHHCGGWGTITTETSESDDATASDDSDDSDVAPPTWRVVTYPRIVKTNLTSFCDYSKSFSSNSDAAAFAAKCDADDVALIFTEDKLDEWIVENSSWEMDAESDPIEVVAEIDSDIAELEAAVIEVARATEDGAMLLREISIAKGYRNSLAKFTSESDEGALDEFKTYIAACQLTAKVRLETATDLTPIDTTKVDEVFRKASLVLTYIKGFESTANPIERLNDIISSIITLEGGRLDSAKYSMDALQKLKAPTKTLDYYADVAIRGEESFKWFNITMAKLLEVKAKYGIKFEETPKATNFNPFQ